MYAPAGKKDGIQLIPVSEVTAKEEFFNIKNVTRDARRLARGASHLAAAHGDLFGANETAPLQRRSCSSTIGSATRLLAFRRTPSARNPLN